MLEFLIINWFFALGFQPVEQAQIRDAAYAEVKNSVTTEFGVSVTAWDIVTLSGSMKSNETYLGITNFIPNFNPYSLDSKIGIDVRLTPKNWKFQANAYAYHDCRHIIKPWDFKVPFDYNYSNSEIGIKFSGSL